jgi:hypothetical protein
LSIPHRKHITSPLRAQQVNAIGRFVTTVYQYNYYNFGHHTSSCLLFKTQLNPIGMCFLHITSPLQAQQVNAVCRFVTTVYQYNYYNFGHLPSSCLLFKTQLNSIGLSVPHRKHITSPLRAHQVIAIYRFLTMVYYIIYYLPVFYLKHNASETGFYLSPSVTCSDGPSRKS